MKRLVFLVTMLFVFFSFAYAETEYRIGVLAKRGSDIASQKWDPTAKYLTDSIPDTRFVIVPLGFDEIKESVKKNQIDFVIANPALYTELEYKYGVTRIATLLNKDSSGACITDFGGVIITKSSRSDILTLNDIKGKTFGAVDQISLGGWVAAWYEFKRSGIDPYSEFSNIQFFGTHDKVVYAVLNGEVDAGTIRTDVLERMSLEGKIDLSKIYVVNNKNLSVFSQFLSTELFPEWPFAMLSGTPDNLANKVAVALLQMPEDSEAAMLRDSCGFTIPKSYERVHGCLKYLQIGPYALTEIMRPADVFKKYKKIISFFIIGFIVVSISAVYVIYLNIRFKKATKALENEIEDHKATRDRLEDRQIEIEIMNDELEKTVDERTNNLIEHINSLDEYNKVIDESTVMIKSSIEGFITYSNDKFNEMFGFDSGCEDIQVYSLFSDQEIFREIRKRVSGGKAWKGLLEVLHADKSVRYCDICFIPVHDSNGRPIEIIGIFNNVTELVTAKKELQSRLYTDNLTGLPNREKLVEDIKNFNEPKVCLIRLDSLNMINDIYGFEFGDTVIQSVGECLVNGFKDTSIEVYKMHGDRYALLTGDNIGMKTFAALVEGVLEEITDKNSECSEKNVFTEFTAGMCDGETPLRGADMALHMAVEQNKKVFVLTNFSVYDKKFRENLETTATVKKAIKDGRIINYYQPIYDMKSNYVVKYECLVRLIDDTGKVLSPDKFLNTAKISSLYPMITKTVMNNAVSILKNSDVELSINISYEDISDENTAEFIFNMLHSDFSERVTIEIVESESMKNVEKVRRFIKRIKSTGAKVAIDDFGSGYSNFENLLKMNIDYLKIDGSLISNIVKDEKSKLLVKHIVSLAKEMGLEIVAEFVSERSIFEYLRKEVPEIRFYQGYYVGRPQECLACDITLIMDL